jgi:hypothetical protein
LYEQTETGLALFDLGQDPGESRDRAKEYPEVVDRLTALAQAYDADLQAHRRLHGLVSEE